MVVRSERAHAERPDVAAHPVTPGGLAINAAAARLDAWLDTMRMSGGYGGPVAHWWQQSLIYTGPGLDWRYEGIIAGYCQLWEHTSDERWLAKACRAGDDIIAGQLTNGHFAASSFELNPAAAGTPHEAACDVGLLLLARTLRAAGRPGWRRYVACATRNLQTFYIDQLWDAAAKSFRDSPRVPSFVPNKAATACEAMFLLAEVTGEASWAEQYAIPNLRRVIAHQLHGRGKLAGAIAQNSFGADVVEKYFPIYIARCIPALLRGYDWTGDGRYADAALRAMQFIVGWGDSDGAFPTVIYPNQRVSRGPRWIAALGDVLRAADELRPYGCAADLSATVDRLLAGQDSSGGIQTARGFAGQAWGKPDHQLDLRDVLHVAGWCDKAFRYLASHAGSALPPATSHTFEVTCKFRGEALRLVETADRLEAVGRHDVCYRWHKDERWPEIAAPAYWLR